MTARDFRILLVALCCVLAFATWAHAECAWVLWGMSAGAPDGGVSAVPLGGWKDREQCEKGRASEQPPRPQKSTFTTRYVCLPDTVDPRGSKGSASAPCSVCWPPGAVPMPSRSATGAGCPLKQLAAERQRWLPVAPLAVSEDGLYVSLARRR
jgi:hypothetical protein